MLSKFYYCTGGSRKDPGWVYIMHDRNDTGQCK